MAHYSSPTHPQPSAVKCRPMRTRSNTQVGPLVGRWPYPPLCAASHRILSRRSRNSIRIFQRFHIQSYNSGNCLLSITSRTPHAASAIGLGARAFQLSSQSPRRRDYRNVRAGGPQPTAMLLVLNIHPSRRVDLLSEQTLAFNQSIEAWGYTARKLLA